MTHLRNIFLGVFVLLWFLTPVHVLADTNLVVGVSPTCSSTYPGFDCNATADQNNNTFWVATGITNEWIKFNLGSAQGSDHATMVWQNYNGTQQRVTDFKVQGSSNGTDWTDIASVSTDTSNCNSDSPAQQCTTSVSYTGVAYQYWRFLMNGTNSQCVVHEVYLYGGSVPTPSTAPTPTTAPNHVIIDNLPTEYPTQAPIPSPTGLPAADTPPNPDLPFLHESCNEPSDVASIGVSRVYDWDNPTYMYSIVPNEQTQGSSCTFAHSFGGNECENLYMGHMGEIIPYGAYVVRQSVMWQNQGLLANVFWNMYGFEGRAYGYSEFAQNWLSWNAQTDKNRGSFYPDDASLDYFNTSGWSIGYIGQTFFPLGTLRSAQLQYCVAWWDQNSVGSIPNLPDQPGTGMAGITSPPGLDTTGCGTPSGLVDINYGLCVAKNTFQDEMNYLFVPKQFSPQNIGNLERTYILGRQPFAYALTLYNFDYSTFVGATDAPDIEMNYPIGTASVPIHFNMNPEHKLDTMYSLLHDLFVGIIYFGFFEYLVSCYKWLIS